MKDTSVIGQRIKEHSTSTIKTMRELIFTPAEFFRKMPRSGGFVDPVIFVASMSFVTGVINLILWTMDKGFATSLSNAFVGIVIMPVFSVIASFISAAVLFIIWKVMGSSESYETAYRCGAYAMAITPVIIILDVVPYIGSVIGFIWMAYIFVTASIEVHGIRKKMAWVVFGVIFGFFLVVNINVMYQSRHFSQEMEQLRKTSHDLDKATIDEARESMKKSIEEMKKKFKND